MFDAAQKHIYYCFFKNSMAFNVIVFGGRGELMLSSGRGTQLFIIKECNEVLDISMKIH